MTDRTSSPEAQARWQAFWKAPLPPTPEQLAAARPQRYVPAGRSLDSYASKQSDPLGRRPGESTESWRRRVLAVVRHLPEDEAAARLAAIDQADQQERPRSGEELHAQLQARQSGVNVGVMGRVEDRASALGSRFGGREIVKNGGLAESIGPAPARVDMAAAWERQRLPVYAQRQEIPSGSSGEGIFVR